MNRTLSRYIYIYVCTEEHQYQLVPPYQILVQTVDWVHRDAEDQPDSKRQLHELHGPCDAEWAYWLVPYTKKNYSKVAVKR
jgi:hypothetical protein